ncbi:MAG: sigma-70 family RNA polymerase sigma factor [Heyndrickxia sp.]
MKTKLGNESSVHEENVTTLINMYPALKRYCRMLTRNGWDAEDLAHEAMEKMYHKYIHQNAKQSNITHALLYKIAHNHWIDEIRKRSKENGVLMSEPSTDPMRGLPEVYSVCELLVNHLTPQQTVIFMLKDIFQFSMSDVAKQLNVTEGAVKASLFRTRQHLGKLIDEEEGLKLNNNLEKEQSRLFFESIIQSIRHEQPAILIKQYKTLFHQHVPMCKGSMSFSLLAAA